MKYIFLTLLIILMGSFLAVCDCNAATVNPSAKTLRVIYRAAKQHHVDAQSLIRIAFVESRFKEDAKRVNENGTIDYGMFQINSVHWTTTCKAFDVFTLDGNAQCAALIISKLQRHVGRDKNWLGRYHSNTIKKKKFYSRLLAKVNIGE